MIHHTSYETRDSIRCLFLVGSTDEQTLEKESYELIRQTASDGVEVEVGVLRELSAEAMEILHAVPLHSHIFTNKNDPFSRKRLPTLLADGGFDALVTMGGEEETFWGRFAAQRNGLSVIASFVPSNVEVNWDNALQKMLVGGTDCFICESLQASNDLVRQSTIPAARVKTLCLGVDTDCYRSHPGQRWQLRQELGLDHAQTVCGLVARSLNTETIEYILAESKWAIAQSDDWRMVILGLHEDQVAAIEQRIAESQLNGKVLVRPDRGDNNVAMSVLDVYVINPTDENPRMDILRAMACGLPVTIPFDSPADDLVVDGLCGLKHDATLNCGAKAWIDLCSNRRRRRQFGRIGQDLVVTHWSVGTAARGLRALILNLHAAKHGPFPPAFADQELPVDCGAMVAL